MSQRNADPPRLASLDEWRCEHVRLTFFTTPVAHGSTESWWLSIVGEEATQVSHQPRTGEKKWEGPFLDGILSLTVQPERIDWIFGAEPERLVADPLTGVGSYPEIVPRVLESLNSWLNDAPAIRRLAYGTVGLLPVSDRAVGYERIQDYLPCVQLDSKSSRDFNYQINRPRRSNVVTDLEINRLSRWSVATARHVSAHVALDSGAMIASTTDAGVALRVQLDINTSASWTDELPKDREPPLVGELSDLAAEILARGDVA